MRILHVVPTYYPAVRYGGPIWSVHSLCKSLVARGHKVTVITTNIDGDGVSIVETGVPVDVDGVEVWYFPSGFLRKIYYSSKMKEYILCSITNFDFVHLHSVFLWPTSVVAKVAKNNNIPYCVSPRGALVKSLIRKKSFIIKTLWIFLFERFTLGNAAFIHATSQIEAEEVGNFQLSPIKIISNGVDIPKIKTTPSFMDKLPYNYQVNHKKYIIFIGRISWKKGLDRLILSLKNIEKVDLLIAGNDEENLMESLIELSKNNNVDNRLHYLGPVYGDEKFCLLKNAQLLVLPSHNENFGNVVLESMSVGTPVVVTNGVGAKYIVEEYSTGIVVSEDPKQMGLEISSLLRDDKALKNMGKKAEEVASRNFSWLKIAQQMENAYKECIH